MSGMVTAIRTQNAFRGRNDDGSQSAATWKANQNTNWTQLTGQNFRVRFRIQETAGASINDTYKVQFSKNGGAFQDVGTATDCRVVDSTHYTDGASTTSQLTGGSGTFGAGFCDDLDNLIPTAGSLSLPLSGYTEIEICLRLAGTWAAGNTCALRVVTSGGSVLEGTYTNPTMTVSLPAAINTDYHVSFPTPNNALASGTDLQKFRAQIYVDGGGSPTGALYLYENGSQIGSAIWSGTVTGTEASPTTVVGLWDASGRTASQIEARFVGTGVAGGTARLYAIEWEALITESSLVNIPGVATDESVGVLTALAGDVTETLTGVASDESVGTLVLDTAYRVSFPTPSQPLTAGADLQEIRANVYVEGTGSPTGELFLYEDGVQVASLWSGTVTGTLASPLTISGTWDGTGHTAADIEARFVGNGVPGAQAKLAAIEWNATIDEPAPQTVSLTGLASDEQAGTLTEVAGDTSRPLVGVASDESVGSLTEAPGVATASLTGVPTDEQVGTLTASVHTFVQLTGVASDESAGVLTEVAGDVSVPLTGLASEESVGVLTESPGTVALPLTGLTTEEQAGALTPSPGDVSLALTGVATEEQVGTLALSTATNRQLTGVASDEQVGTLTAVAGDTSQGLAGVASDEQTGTLTALAGDVSVPLTGLASDEAVGTLTPSTASTRQLTGVSSDEQVGALTAVAGDTTQALTGVPSDESAGTLTELPGTSVQSLTGLATEEQAGSLTVVGEGFLPLSGVPSDELTGTLTAVAGDVSVQLTGVASDELVGTLTKSQDAVEVPLTGVPSDEQTGSLVAQPGTSPQALTGVPSDEQAGSLVAEPGISTQQLAGVPSDEQVGVLDTQVGEQTIALTGVASDEDTGFLAAEPQPVIVSITGLSSEESVGTLDTVPYATRQLVGVASDEQVGILTYLPGTSVQLLPGVGSEEQVGLLGITGLWEGNPQVSLSVRPKPRMSLAKRPKEQAALTYRPKPVAHLTQQ